ncbi:putative aminotransferase [Achaetomium macrosporum]|uniref:Aminotransferase n=1 Tax=Achaetomium macrosporum TaxID=79813 RepID=A0AAN7C8D8_9PEZI|nr:putative aminotransferase [Achaetomium macrosporum]
MHHEVVEFITKNVVVDPIHHLTYGAGPNGSPRLRKALASFLNSNFQPRGPVSHDDILILPGVTSVIDCLAWSICNEGEGIIIPQPFYMGFAVDIPTRARGVIVPALFHPLEDYRGLDDVFDSGMNIKALESALRGAEEKGIRIRAVLLTNPHNPLGRCYAAFCGRHSLHLISDEIYANSVFDNPQAPGPVPFTSILALDFADQIDPQLIHVAYGASKDFCANGLRLGMLYTKNRGLQAAVAGTSMLAWPPYMIQELWASMLEDEDYTKGFFTRNQQRLAEQYVFATRFLDENKIPYYRNSNAGMFIWMDRRYLTGGDTAARLSVHRLTPRERGEYQQREMEIGNRCFANGVAIALGTNFFTEELGWFRLSFTASRSALETGLQRVLKALQEIERLGW